MKLSFIPAFINDKMVSGKRKGYFSGAVLFVDIKGFTKITRELMTHGDEGAEILSDIINKIFSGAIDSIYKKGGFISSFAGDAFTAIFENDKGLNCPEAAQNILKHVKKNKTISTKYGKFKIEVRIGISYGRIYWEIIPGKIQSVYLFKGKTILEAAEAEQKCREGSIEILNRPESPVKNKIKSKYLPLQKNIVKKFIPDQVLESKISGEFREIISIFVSFDTKQVSPAELIPVLADLSLKYGGFLNKTDYGDKGAVALIMFGAPLSVEKKNLRAFSMMSELIQLYPSVSAGVSLGTVYAGLIGNSQRCEYSCLGDTVNMSSRLMSKADLGQVLVDISSYSTGKEYGEFKYHGSFGLKGIKKDQKLYVFEGLKKNMTKKTGIELVGRETELAKLKDHLGPLRKSKFAGIIHVIGAAGIGKSLLVDHFLSRIDLSVYQIMELECDPILKESLNPFIGFLKDHFGISDQLSQRSNLKAFKLKYDEIIKNTNSKELSERLEDKRKFIIYLLNLDVNNTLQKNFSPNSIRTNTNYALKTFFIAYSRLKPLIIRIEDIHDIDHDSEEIFKILLTNIKDEPILIIATSRPVEKNRDLPLKDNDNLTSKIKLKPIVKAKTKEMIEFFLKYPVSNEIVKLISKKCSGNPFFIEQLAKLLKESGKLKKKAGKFHLRSGNIQIPSKINSLIISRIDRLRTDLKSTLQSASILGVEFSINILSGMVGGDDLKLKLMSIEEDDLLYPVTELKYIFKHALVRDSIYEMMLKKTLRELHTKAAEIIEKNHVDDIDLYIGSLAYHYENAGIKGKAKYYLTKAAEQANENYKSSDALNYYGRLLNYTKAGSKRHEIEINRIRLLKRLGKWDECEELIKNNLKSIKSEHYRCVLMYYWGDILLAKGDYDNSIKKIRECIAAGKSKKKLRSILSLANRNIGSIHWRKGENKEALKYMETYLKSSAEVQDRKEIANALGDLGIINWNLGNNQKALKYYRKRKKINIELGDKENLIRTLNNTALVLNQIGKKEQAVKLYKEQLKGAREIDDKQMIGYAYLNMGIVFLETGKTDDALVCFQKNYDNAMEIGEKRTMVFSLGNMGICHSDRGNFDKAMDLYSRQIELAKKISMRPSEGNAYGNMADMLKKQDKFKEAEHYYDLGIKILKETNSAFFLCGCLYNKASMLFDIGRINEAEILNLEAYEIAEKINRIEMKVMGKVLKARLLYTENPKKAVSMIKELIENQKDSNAMLSRIYFNLFMMNRSKKTAQKAIALNKAAFAKNKGIDHKIMIEKILEII